MSKQRELLLAAAEFGALMTKRVKHDRIRKRYEEGTECEKRKHPNLAEQHWQIGSCLEIDWSVYGPDGPEHGSLGPHDDAGHFELLLEEWEAAKSLGEEPDVDICDPCARVAQAYLTSGAITREIRIWRGTLTQRAKSFARPPEGGQPTFLELEHSGTRIEVSDIRKGDFVIINGQSWCVLEYSVHLAGRAELVGPGGPLFTFVNTLSEMGAWFYRMTGLQAKGEKQQ